jgi:hypothetical protein
LASTLRRFLARLTSDLDAWKPARVRHLDVVQAEIAGHPFRAIALVHPSIMANARFYEFDGMHGVMAQVALLRAAHEPGESAVGTESN